MVAQHKTRSFAWAVLSVAAIAFGISFARAVDPQSPNTSILLFFAALELSCGVACGVQAIALYRKDDK